MGTRQTTKGPPSEPLLLFDDLSFQATLPNFARPTLSNNLGPQDREALLRKSVRGMNAAQRAAVEHVEGPLLVLAGAGSGKTRVVTNRIAYLTGLGFRPGRILAVTFTNKAREEMHHRCRALLREHTWARPVVLTLHGFGSRILREHASVVGYSDQVRLVSDIYQDKFLERGLRQLSPYQLHEAGGRPLEKLQAQIGLWKSRLLGPRDLALSDEIFAPAYVEYQKELHRAGLVDCDDLLRLPVAIFKDPLQGPAILQQWRRKFDFILVDEYQDTNHAQDELLRLLAGGHQNLCVVGDDDQSIYGWRAADVGLIRAFPAKWADAKTIKLETCYRCTQPILNLSNRLMTHEKERHQKMLVSARSGGAEPVVIAHQDELSEADWIVKTIMDSGQPLHDFAILVRSTLRLAPIRAALEEARLPYEIWRRDLFRLGEIKRNVYSLLAAAHDPEREDPAFFQLLEDSVFALPSSDFEALMQQRDEGSDSFWRILHAGGLSAMSAQGRAAAGQLVELVETLHAEAMRTPRVHTLSEIARRGMAALYPKDTAPEAWQAQHPKSEATKNLRQICGYIETFERKAPRPSFKTYLGHLERIKRKTRQAKPAENGEKSAIIISTIHGAKGLEFANVFMPGLNEGLLPSNQALRSGEEAQLAEERRLFYVAATRAKNMLYLSWPMERQSRYGSRPQFASRYLIESGAFSEVARRQLDMFE
ncbi:MAG: ATP-dependent helicase [Oligoflexia bacterium]|nr:ATP-dependent helicase [Oligoflexia bacterium]